MAYPRKKRKYRNVTYVWRIFNKTTKEVVTGRRSGVDFYVFRPTWKKIRMAIDRNLQQGFTEEFIKENYFIVKYKLVEVKEEEIRDSTKWYDARLRKRSKENGEKKS